MTHKWLVNDPRSAIRYKNFKSKVVLLFRSHTVYHYLYLIKSLKFFPKNTWRVTMLICFSQFLGQYQKHYMFFTSTHVGGVKISPTSPFRSPYSFVNSSLDVFQSLPVNRHSFLQHSSLLRYMFPKRTVQVPCDSSSDTDLSLFSLLSPFLSPTPTSVN